MECVGYQFVGWFNGTEDEEGNVTYGAEVDFNAALTGNTTVYAKWTEEQTANYTVVICKERMPDTYAATVYLLRILQRLSPLLMLAKMMKELLFLLMSMAS